MAAALSIDRLLSADRLLRLATPYALAVSVPYALAFAAVAAEVAWLARRPGPSRRAVLASAATAATMAAGALVVGVAYTAGLRLLWGMVATRRWEAAAGFWGHHPVAGAAVTFVAWDLAGWIYHVVGHRTRVGWAAHRVHHTGSGYDATLGLRQTWAPFHGLAIHPLLALGGFDLRVVFVCAAVSNCWQVLEHTSLPVRFPRWFSALVMTPAAHRHHHGRSGGLVNMGPFFTCWDRLAGTWVDAACPAPAVYGPEVAAPVNPFALELAGWLQLARSGGSPLHQSVGGPARFLARKYKANCAARGMAEAGTARLNRLPNMATTPAKRSRPSTAAITIQPTSAACEPPPALWAKTHPPTTTPTATASITTSARRMTNRTPPLMEGPSASIIHS